MLITRRILTVLFLMTIGGLAWSGEFDQTPPDARLQLLPVGAVIDTSNVVDFREVLAPTLADLIAAGKTTITIGATSSVPTRPT